VICFYYHRPLPTIFYKVVACGDFMSPSFAVPADCPWRERLRPSPTAALAAPSLHPPQAALGFATVVLRPLRLPIPLHRQVLS